MSSGRKSINTYYAKAAPKTILTCALFLIAAVSWQRAVTAHRGDLVMRDFAAASGAFTCAGIGRAAVHHAGLRRPAARPCDGR
jgi:hypothetical protein